VTPIQSESAEKDTQAQALVKLAETFDLFHTPDNVPYATITINNHSENWPIKSERFQLWLKRQFYKQQGKPPSAQALTDAIGVLICKSLFEGQAHDVYLRVAGDNNKIWIDLCNEQWQVVEIDNQGWKVIDKSPVKFRRNDSMAPLPPPESGGSIGDLRQFLNCSDDDWRLIVAWMLATFRTGCPYPILAIRGEQGSAKSTTARILKALADPNQSPLNSTPNEERDLWVVANNEHALVFDNLSGLTNRMSDAFCKLSTGGGLKLRKLFTNDEVEVFKATRPCIFNGIEDVICRPDLAERSVSINLPAIEKNGRRDEKTLWQEFNAARPKILGAICTVLSQALRELPNTSLKEKPRMADFVLWITAAESALGWENHSFVKLYQKNLSESTGSGLEADTFASALCDLLTDVPEWSGSWKELLEKLSDGKPVREWPASAKGVSNRLVRLSPMLRQAGIDWSNDRVGNRRLYKVWKTSGVSGYLTNGATGGAFEPPDTQNLSGENENLSGEDIQRRLHAGYENLSGELSGSPKRTTGKAFVTSPHTPDRFESSKVDDDWFWEKDTTDIDERENFIV